MLDLLLKLIEQIVKLLKERRDVGRHWFDDVVEPVFKRLEPVAKDYIEFFRSAAELAASAAATPKNKQLLEDAITVLEKKRADTVQARRVVQRLAEEAKEKAPKPIAAFCGSVEEFFYSTGMLVPGSHAVELFDVFRAVADRRIPSGGEWWRADLGRSGALTARALAGLCQAAERNLNAKWERICREYAQLRIALPK